MRLGVRDHNERERRASHLPQGDPRGSGGLTPAKVWLGLLLLFVVECCMCMCCVALVVLVTQRRNNRPSCFCLPSHHQTMFKNNFVLQRNFKFWVKIALFELTFTAETLTPHGTSQK